MAEEEERSITSRTFNTYGRPLEMVNSFRYLGRVISGSYDDWPAVFRNLEKARSVWRRMKGVISRERA